MRYKIVNAISSLKVPAWGNQKKYIAVHYLGVVGQAHDLAADGCGAHYYIYWDGTIYQRCSHDAIPWAVGTAGYYTQKHPDARNSNTISIEMCCKCGGNAQSAEDQRWYFTQETQESCAWLVAKIMKDESIPLDHVLRHYDIVNKICPAPYVHNNRYRETWTWEEFRKNVQIQYSGKATQYYIRKTFGNKKSQIGAYASLENAKKACKPGYHVYDSAGKKVYTPPAFEKRKKYRMLTALSIRKEPGGKAPFLMYRDIPAEKKKLFKKGKDGRAMIKKGVGSKCLGEYQKDSKNVYMKISRGWVLARYKGKDRVEKE